MSLFQADRSSESQRHGSPPRRRFLDARLCALALFLAASTCLLAAVRAPTAPRVAAAPQPARPPSRRAARPPAIDYSNFSHSSPKHLARDCNACHRIASFERPDIEDYPDHPACVECHRRQFFRGARPAICSNCHTVTGPRAEARFEFPRKGRPAEFADVFPHSNHVKATSLIQFKRLLGDKATTMATCQHCHKPDARDFRKLTGARPADYAPEPGTFMATPTSHATCFQCHWRDGVDGREQEPLASRCASCHRNISAPARVTTAAATVSNAANPHATPPGTRANANPGADANTNANINANTNANANARRAAGTAPAANLLAAGSRGGPARPVREAVWPARVTAKFVHEDAQHKRRTNEEGREVPMTCLQCHAAARRATTLEALRLRENRVQLQTCASTACHTAVSGVAQLRTSVFRELRERGKDAKFDCALCHLPPVSNAAEVPCGHYATVYASAVKEKKNTKGIEQLTPPRCRDALK